MKLMYKIKNKKHRSTYTNELKLMKPVLWCISESQHLRRGQDDQEFKVIVCDVLRLKPAPACATKDPVLTTETQNKNKQTKFTSLQKQ